MKEAEDFRTECSMLVVSDDVFYWKGYIKHTDCLWDTDTISIEELRVALAPVRKLPLLLDRSESKAVNELVVDRIRKERNAAVA